MSTTNVTWDQIRKQLTEKDIDHMKRFTGGDMDLSDCKSVHDWAQQIYEQVSAGTMPPGDPWSPEWITVTSPRQPVRSSAAPLLGNGIATP